MWRACGERHSPIHFAHSTRAPPHPAHSSTLPRRHHPTYLSTLYIALVASFVREPGKRGVALWKDDA